MDAIQNVDDNRVSRENFQDVKRWQETANQSHTHAQTVMHVRNSEEAERAAKLPEREKMITHRSRVLKIHSFRT